MYNLNTIFKIFKFKTISIISISLILVLFIFTFFIEIHPLFYFAIIFLWAISAFFGSYYISSNFYLNSISEISDSSYKIAITFDDGPDENITPEILEILDKYHFKASFFVIGSKAEKNRDLIKKIYVRGHTLGNHGYTHSNLFGFFSTKKVKKEIILTNKIIESVTSEPNILFRPPFGVTNPNIANAVNRLKMRTIAWSIRSLDTVKSIDDVLKRIKDVKPGDIVLFHDTKENTPEILEHFLRLCKEKSLKSFSLDELLNN